MNTTTQIEKLDVKVKKLHGLTLISNCICDNMSSVHKYSVEDSEMANQQASLFEGEKTCKVCKTAKGIEKFRLVKNRNRDKKERVYRHSMCIECEQTYNHSLFRSNYDRETANAKMRAWRASHPDEARAEGKKWAKHTRDKQRIKVYEAYGNVCKCCGESNYMFLTIDHVNNDGHIERKQYSQGGLYSRIIQENFPERYQLLCWNCNTGKRRNNGVCPHQEASTVIPEGSRGKRPEALSIQNMDDDMTYSLVKAKAAR